MKSEFADLPMAQALLLGGDQARLEIELVRRWRRVAVMRGEVLLGDLRLHIAAGVAEPGQRIDHGAALGIGVDRLVVGLVRPARRDEIGLGAGSSNATGTPGISCSAACFTA
jgi:hypothetical protein